jgi:antiviral helicase SLH1
MIDAFEPWIRPTYKGYASLNRVQSIVFPIAFGTNENILVCAPTGAVSLIINDHRVKQI